MADDEMGRDRHRHLQIEIDAPTHEAVRRWSSRSSMPASTLVRDLVQAKLRQLGLLTTTPNDVAR